MKSKQSKQNKEKNLTKKQKTKRKEIIVEAYKTIEPT